MSMNNNIIALHWDFSSNRWWVLGWLSLHTFGYYSYGDMRRVFHVAQRSPTKNLSPSTNGIFFIIICGVVWGATSNASSLHVSFVCWYIRLVLLFHLLYGRPCVSHSHCTKSFESSQYFLFFFSFILVTWFICRQCSAYEFEIYAGAFTCSISESHWLCVSSRKQRPTHFEWRMNALHSFWILYSRSARFVAAYVVEHLHP